MPLPPMGVEAVIRGLPSYLSGMRDMGDATSRTSGLLGKIGGVATAGFKALAIGATAAVGAIGAVGGAMLKLASDAAPLAGVSQAFEGITADIEGGSATMLKALQEASYGMTTNADLMKSFNLAAQLVSRDFAEQLPDAMQYLSKVAAATGQDMGYMMDSLVRGVGRLSPMILDNLAIQVDLTSAYEEWAKVNGRTVDSMSKTEQQAAVMAQVMAKLAENTASMPEIAGSAQQSFASFGVQMKNFKDELGLALLPVASKFMKTLSELASKILPKVVNFVKKYVVPIFEKVGYVFSAIVDAGFGSIEMWETLENLLGRNVVDGIKKVWNWFEKLIEPIKALIAGEFTIKDIIPSWIFKVWEDFMGVIDKFRDWWARNGPTIKEQAGRIFDTFVETVNKLAEEIIPWLVEQFDKISGWFDEHEEQITGAIENIADFFENTLGPAVTDLWNNVLEPFFTDFIDLLLDVGDAILDLFGGKKKPPEPFGPPGGPYLDPGYVEDLRSPFEKLSDALDEFFLVKFPKIFVKFRDWVLNFFGLPNWQTVVDSWEGIWDNLLTILDWFGGELRTKINEFAAYVTDFVDDLQLLLRALQFDPLAIQELLEGEFGPPSLDWERRSIPQSVPANPSTFSGGTSSTTNMGDNYNLHIHTSAPTEDIMTDFRIMKAMGSRV